LITQLRKAGFNAYTLPKVPVEGKLTRVFVGPEVSEEKLKARQQPIFKLTGLKGKIVAYNPQEQ
jgi:DedD protein